MNKYLCINDFIKKHENEPVSTVTTFKDLIDEFKSMSDVEMIPREYIEKWFQEHYGVHDSPLVRDYLADSNNKQLTKTN